MNNQMTQFSWQWLRACPFCGVGREVLKTDLIQENTEGSWFYFQCPNCLVGLVFVLGQSNNLPTFFGWPTDLTYLELKNYAEDSELPLRADEVLTVHEFFAKNNQVNSFIK